MQVSNTLSFSDLKTVSTQSVPRIDRSPIPASLNSSSTVTFASLTPDVVTFSNPVPTAESSDLLIQVNQTGNTPDISPNANQITAEQENIGTEQGSGTAVTQADDSSAAAQSASTNGSGDSDDESQDATNTERQNGNDSSGTGTLTPQEREQVAELIARDAQVKAHERAHQAAGGQYTGSISYTFQRGPDGKRYAIGGEVPIDVSPVAGDAQATIDKMRTVKSAAMAPSDPSTQDRAVASTAGRLLIQAQVNLAEEKRIEQSEARDVRAASPEQRVQITQQYESIVGLETETKGVSEIIDEMI